MAKWYGKIGFAESVQTSPGMWEEKIVERNYYGELGRTSRRLYSADSINDNVDITNDISIVADPYANEHFFAIRYVEFAGAKWKVSNVSVQYPRLILSTGGLYNA